jgi:hypothetical protein
VSRFQFSTELQGKNQGTTGQQMYTDTVITLAAPDRGYGKTLRRKGNAVMTELTGEQEGQMWKIAKVGIPPIREAVNF